MKKLVNLRIPLLLACFLASGIVTGCVFFCNSIELIWIVAAVPFAAVILIFTLLFKKGAFIPATVILIAVIFITGTVYSYLKIAGFEKSRIADKSLCSICATVSDKSANGRGEYIILTDIYSGDIKIDGSMIVYLGEAYGDFCDIGYTVKFNAAVNKNKAFVYGKPNYFLLENIKYSCNVYSGVISKEGFSLFGSVRIAIRDTLFENLDSQTAAIAYGMLTGNTQFIGDGALENFRYGGIAHIFAVSGLHIGIIFGIFYFLSKRLRFKKRTAICFCILPVFFYAGICGFTPSCVRAAVMCTISLLARKNHKKYDGLNSLSAAVIVILLINPITIFAVGFQLSVFAVGGIILFSSGLSNRFKRLPRKITAAVCSSLGAQAGTLPVMLSNFGYVSGAGLLLSFIILPLFSIEFAVLFISTAIALIMPFLSSFILPCAVLPLEFTVSFLIDAGFENALIKGFGAGLFLPVYYFGLAVASDKINIRLLTRLATLCCTAVILISYVLIKMFMPFYDFTVAVSAYYGGGEVLIKARTGNVLIITEDITPTQTCSFLNNSYTARPDAVILLGGNDCALNYTDLQLDCTSVYVFDGHLPIQPFNGIRINYERQFNVCGIDFEFADGYSVMADCGGVDIAVCSGGAVPFGRCNILISDIAENYCSFGYQVSFNERNVQYCIYNDGDISFAIKDGQIK